MEVTEDALLGGRVRLRQPAKGYRAGLDAALLAAACEAGPGDRVLDVGCGPGAALLQVALRRPGTRVTGLEREADMAALARENLALNGLLDRGAVLEGDVAEGFAGLGLPPFDEAVCNPPFFDDPGTLRAPHPSRRSAWMADAGLGAWVAFLLGAVRDGGRVTMIHRAERLPELLALLSAKAGSIAVRPVQPFAEAPAKRVLVRAVRSARGPFRLLPALVLHPADRGRHTPETDALLRGEAALDWS